jgi:hypothetical protein
MPQSERDKYLLDLFKQSFGAWRNMVESYEHEDENTIRIKMKKGDYYYSGKTLIFGDGGCDQLYMHVIGHPAKERV